MAKGQKEAVVEQVLNQIPTFKKHIDNAILVLSNLQLELIKTEISYQIGQGLIEYSKDKNNTAEVRTYARSMVMNHLKKAKELNGGHAFKSVSVSVTGDIDNTGTSSIQRIVRTRLKLAPKGVNPDLLPEDLKEYVKSLV